MRVTAKDSKKISYLFRLLKEEYDDPDNDLIVSIIRDIGRTFGYEWSIAAVKSVIK